MGEKMTPALDDKLRCLQSLLQQMGANVACKTVGEARDALLTAPLTHPAQAVDVGAIEAVIRELCKWPKDETFYDHRATRLACAEKLRALAKFHPTHQEKNDVLP